MATLLLIAVLRLGLPQDAAPPAESPIYARTTIDIGVVVSDLERSVKFYRDDLGLVPAVPPGFDVPGELAKDAGLDDGTPLQVKVFNLGPGPGATSLKLMAIPGAKKGDSSTVGSGLGPRYLTLFVKDLGAVLDRMKGRSIPVVAKGPVVLGGGTGIAFVRDPDGNFVEFVGPLGKREPAGGGSVSTPLFNGKDLAGWSPLRKGTWKVEDGAIVGGQSEGNGGGWLVHEKAFGDFDLRFRFRISKGGNSGVAFRFPGGESQNPSQSGYEFQVGDADPRFATASVFGLKKAPEGLLKEGEWNEGRVVVAGNRITTYLNGKEVVAVESDRSARGRIGLQVHGTPQYAGMKVEFKEIEIAEK